MPRASLSGRVNITSDVSERTYPLPALVMFTTTAPQIPLLSFYSGMHQMILYNYAAYTTPIQDVETFISAIAREWLHGCIDQDSMQCVGQHCMALVSRAKSQKLPPNNHNIVLRPISRYSS